MCFVNTRRVDHLGAVIEEISRISGVTENFSGGGGLKLGCAKFNFPWGNS